MIETKVEVFSSYKVRLSTYICDMTVFFTLAKKLHFSVYQPHIKRLSQNISEWCFIICHSSLHVNSDYREFHSDSFGGHYYKLMLNTLLPISFYNKHHKQT